VKITAAQALVKCLEQENVKTVFGYPGAAICPFYDCLIESPIEHVLVRHEANAGHAASGYARITGSPAVCATTSGPGALNIITAVATAYMDSIPLIVITGQVSSDQIGKDVFQEADTTGAAEPFVKHSYLIKDAAELPELVKKAFYIAGTGRPGPVLLDIPFDVLRTEIDFFEYPETVDIRGYKPSFSGNKLQIKRAAEAIEESDKPLICAGGGLFNRNAHVLARSLAELSDIPVISTMMGIGALPSDHPLYYGMIGMHGRDAANNALNDCDLLILLGARVNDRAVLALKNDKKRVIHIDIDPAEIGKNLPASIPIVGDAGAVLEQMLEMLTLRKRPEWHKHLRQPITVDVQTLEPEPKTDCVNPKDFILLLNKLIPEKTVISADVGQNQIWTASNISLGEKGRFITSGGMGTMGYSVPAAIGAKKAAPDREVIAICGDGSFQMQMMELATAIQHNVGVKIIVMVNNRLGMVRELQKNVYGGRITAVALDGSPDFVKLAAAYGIGGDYVTDIAKAEKSLIALLASKKPYLLQVSVDKDERSLQ